MRTDDYKNAIKLAAKDLDTREAQRTASLSGASFQDGALNLNFMNRPVKVTVPGYAVGWAEAKTGEEFALTDAVIVLHYLQGANGLGPTGELLAYRQIPGGEFYTAAFRKRAEIPLIKTFGQKPGLLTKAGAALGGAKAEGFGDEAVRFQVLPNLEVLTVIHQGDEEFEPDGQVLFDRSINGALSIEDIAWLGSAVVYRLMGLSKGLS
ncbi:MAG: DUF3786 domain-containing protein [Deltaproteobacteria bacterium]|nr:DUF3786 domain-containing protein [Deltaproteobacteria bacterium]